MAVIGDHVDVGVLDWSQTFFDRQLEKEVVTGQTIGDEGRVLIRVLDGGKAKVQESAGAGADVFYGIALKDTLSLLTMPLVDSKTIPAAAPYRIQLDRTNLVGAMGATTVWVYDVTAGAAFSSVNEVAGAGAVLNTNQYYVNYTLGQITFFSARAGHVLLVQYRYNMTAAERQLRFQENGVNLGGSDSLAQCGVGIGPGEVYTLYYDTSQDYSALPVIYTGAAGMPTADTTSTITIGRTISVPSATDPFLGFELYPPA